MGRQKQNKPRRERPSIPSAALTPERAQGHQRVRTLAGMLDLPTIISSGQTGVALDVAAVGFAGDGLTTDDKPAYVRLADGSVKLLPEALRPWARGVIAADLDLRETGEASMFPCRIEFGVIDGEAYAEVL
jgi:hypothetical protein